MVKAKIPNNSWLASSFRSSFLRFFLQHPVGLFFTGTVGFTSIFCLAIFGYFYVKYSRMIEEKLAAGPFTDTSMVFAAPRQVRTGDEVTADEIITQLRRSNYGESRSNRMGAYAMRAGALEIYPGPDSYFQQEDDLLKFQDGKLAQIISLRDNTERTIYTLEPELVTNLFDRNREKRRLVKFDDIPKILVNAVVSAEDKRFFQHAGFDPLRIIKAAYVDVKRGYRAQGASTLTMQLARAFWLTPEKTWRRKIPETLITLHLERKLTKEQIFEYYANQIPLGRRGSFNICGFGEAAQAYFGKDVKQLTLAEAATLAGLIQRPSYTNPFRWPDRAQTRRNVVLKLMLENGYITDREYGVAVASPMNVSHGSMESTDAPYFIDLVNDELQDQFQGHDFQSHTYRVFSSIDMNLQRAASEAVKVGMKEVDDQLRKRNRKGELDPEPQVALVALDPNTGEVKALVGGRNYGMSQLNRVLAKRQPGSSFKPFVYAAALNSALHDGGTTFTPISTVVDEPTTFWFDGRPYEPKDFHGESLGVVTLRTALAKSLNIPTVKVAEAVGYGTVVDLARRAGMNLNIHPTPAVALGAYEVTPLEIAGAYTVFANHGLYLKPHWVNSIRDETGKSIFEAKIIPKPVLDPRVSYLMVSMLEEVMRSGTAAGTRSRGFLLPAAGKTGTSHDGWFAGFTSKLLCIVWVGYDNNKELPLEGARSALPVWTEFMKRAHQFREYRGATPFSAPDGIIGIDIDPTTGQLAGPNCPTTRTEVFLAGTQPNEFCRLHGGGSGNMQVAGWEASPATPAQSGPAVTQTAGISDSKPPAPQSANGQPAKVARNEPPQQIPAPAESNDKEKPKQQKRGFFGRMRELFK